MRFIKEPWVFMNFLYVNVISPRLLKSKKNCESVLLIPILGDTAAFEENRGIKEEGANLYRNRQGVSRVD